MNSLIRFFDAALTILQPNAISVAIMVGSFFLATSGFNLLATKTKVVTEVFYDKEFERLFFFDER